MSLTSERVRSDVRERATRKWLCVYGKIELELSARISRRVALRCDAIRCDAMQHDMIRCDAVQYGARIIMRSRRDDRDGDAACVPRSPTIDDVKRGELTGSKFKRAIESIASRCASLAS